MTTDNIGEPGAPGETGATGTPGATGASGATGAAGARGHVGRAGERGPTGQQGPEGGATPALAATLRDLARSIDRMNLRSMVNLVTTAINALAVVLLIVVLLQLSDTAGNTNRILNDVEAVTSPDARKAQADATQALIDSLVTTVRRSIDCSGYYFQGERPPACADVDKRLDTIEAGGDPFTHPSTTTTTRP